MFGLVGQESESSRFGEVSMRQEEWAAEERLKKEASMPQRRSSKERKNKANDEIEMVDIQEQ